MAERGLGQRVMGLAADRAELDAAGLEAALGLVPMRRYGKPSEIAAAMAFLASDDAAYITGQVLRVNGGMSMGG